MTHPREHAPKPSHLGPSYAEQFGDPSVVAAYRYRPAYPGELIAHLAALATGRRALLDVGCGRGDLSVPLASHFERVDAVDPSAAMLAAAQRIAGSGFPQVRWIPSTLAAAPLDPPYDLVTAGQSLHWTDWSVAFERIARVLAPGAGLAIVQRIFEPSAWEAELTALIGRYSTNREYEPYDLLELLGDRGLFVPASRFETAPVTLDTPLADYIESCHSANGLSRDRMPAEDAAAFDSTLRKLVLDHQPDGKVPTGYRARVDFGRPTPG